MADTPIPDVFASLNAFERAVFGRNTAEATPLLLKLLDDMAKHAGLHGLLPEAATQDQGDCFYTRIAAAIGAYLRSPDLTLRVDDFDQLCMRKPMLEAAFACSGFHDSMHLLEYFSQVDANGEAQLDERCLANAILCLSLDATPPSLLQGILTLPLEILFPLTLGWLNNQTGSLTEQGEANRGVLLAQAPSRLEKAAFSPKYTLALGTAWMYCSYASAPWKHEIKRALNRLWLKLAEQENVRPRCTERRIVPRPTLLVVVEYMTSGHAMYRCYAPRLQALRSRFRLVLLAEGKLVDAPVEALFDESVKAANNLPGIVGQVTRIAPDLIYFPSLGMNSWTIVLANLRLAPIQFMSFGHPASSMSDAMDYALHPRDLADAAASIHETVILTRSDSHHAPNLALPAVLPQRTRPDDGAIHVALNCTSMKLTYRLLDVCRRIEADAGRPVHFHFFPYVHGVLLDSLRRQLAARFVRASIYTKYDYAEFLAKLAQCDLSLAAFPFGNTNSTVDACLLGIPVVAYYAPEPLSQADRLVMQRLDLPDWLMAGSDEAYYQAALRLIRNDDERLAISRHLREIDVYQRMFAPTQDEDPDEFVNAVWWIYENHERIQASGKHVLEAGVDVTCEAVS